MTGGDVARGTSNRYELLARLAEGGMAEIFLARAGGIAGFERYVVLKRIRPERGEDPQWVSMFLDEARLAAQLQHPNIAQVFDIGEIEDSYFYTMEYVHGEDALAIQSRLAALGQTMPLHIALAIAHGASQGLAYAHERCGADGKPLNIVHRDVSPSNVMVTYEGVVKVLDFGVAKARTRSNETQVGTIMGKVAYLSPEQCRARTLDHRSDIFSLGIVLYELLTQHRPFKRNSDHETIHAIVKFAPPPPSEINPGLPFALDALVMKMLSKDPAVRFGSAGELIDAIEALADELRLTLAPRELKRYMRDLFGMRPEPWRVMLVGTEALKTFEGSVIGPMGPLTEMLVFEIDAIAEEVPLLPARNAPDGTPGATPPADDLDAQMTPLVAYKPVPRRPPDDEAPTINSHPANAVRGSLPPSWSPPPLARQTPLPRVIVSPDIDKSGSVIVPPSAQMQAQPSTQMMAVPPRATVALPTRRSWPVVTITATIAIAVAIVGYFAFTELGASSATSAAATPTRVIAPSSPIEPAAKPTATPIEKPAAKPTATPIDETKPTDPKTVAKPPTPTNDKPTNDKPSVATPTKVATPTNDKPTNEKPSVATPTNEKPTTDKPTNDKPSVATPTNEKPSVATPTNEKPSVATPTNDKPSVATPTNDKPTNEKPSVAKPTNDVKAEPSKPIVKPPVVKPPVVKPKSPVTKPKVQKPCDDPLDCQH